MFKFLIEDVYMNENGVITIMLIGMADMLISVHMVKTSIFTRFSEDLIEPLLSQSTIISPKLRHTPCPILT